MNAQSRTMFLYLCSKGKTNPKIQCYRKYKERISRELFIKTSLVAKLLYLKFCNSLSWFIPNTGTGINSGSFLLFHALKYLLTLLDFVAAFSIFKFFLPFHWIMRMWTAIIQWQSLAISILQCETSPALEGCERGAETAECPETNPPRRSSQSLPPWPLPQLKDTKPPPALWHSDSASC